MIFSTILKHGFSQDIWIFSVKGLAKRRAPGLVNFVPAVAYPFCLALPAAFTQPGDRLLADISCVKSHNQATSHYFALGLPPPCADVILIPHAANSKSASEREESDDY